MINTFVLETPGKVVSAPGCIKELPELLPRIGRREAVILCDPGVAGTGMIDSIKKGLESDSWVVNVIDSIPREPDVESAGHLLEAFRCLPCSVLIGVGGGSVLDLAKLFGCLHDSRHSVPSVLKDSGLLKRKLYTCLVPTTAGTGSEATRNVILSNPEEQIKEAVIHSLFLPDLVLLDPELTLTLPKETTASTGLDALAHAVECYVSRKAVPLSDLLARDAIERICRSLDSAYKDGGDLNARADMLTASFFAGMCISLSGTTAVHALAYPLGAVYHVPHGSANAMLLAPVMDFNSDVIGEKLHDAARCFGINGNYSAEAASRMIIEKLYSLVERLEIPRRLRDYGISRDDIPLLTERAFSIKRLLNNNPKEMDKKKIAEIYERVY